MKILLVSALLMMASFVGYIEGHAEMLIPPNRGSVWRFDRSFPRVYWNHEWCDFETRENPRNATCGICGPVYNGDPSVYTDIVKTQAGKIVSVPSLEVEGPIYRGIPVVNYTQGQVIDIKIWHVAIHGGGPQSFHVCEASYKKDPTQKCLDANPLVFEATGLNEDVIDPSNAVLETVPPSKFQGNMFNYKVKLPSDLTCEHCVLQWKWTTPIAYGRQMYRSCADIRIL